MDTGYERRLAARARELADLSGPRAGTLECLAAARHAGLDPDALAGLVGCAAALGASSTATYTAGAGPAGCHRDEREFIACVAGIEDDLGDHLHAASQLARQATDALTAAASDLDDARADLAGARRQLAAARAMPARHPCDGCHDARRDAIADAQEAIAAAQEDIRDCRERTGICKDVSRFTQALARRLRWALARIRAVPADLGETYESAYQLIRHGGALPRDGRWITGTTT